MKTHAVYMVTHVPTGRAYVGVTGRPLHQRWKDHLRDAANGGAVTLLGAAIAEHGEEEFRLETIVMVSARAATARERAEMEDRDTFFPKGFNRLPGATSRVRAERFPEGVLFINNQEIPLRDIYLSARGRLRAVI